MKNQESKTVSYPVVPIPKIIGEFYDEYGSYVSVYYSAFCIHARERENRTDVDFSFNTRKFQDNKEKGIDIGFIIGQLDSNVTKFSLTYNNLGSGGCLSAIEASARTNITSLNLKNNHESSKVSYITDLRYVERAFELGLSELGIDNAATCRDLLKQDINRILHDLFEGKGPENSDLLFPIHLQGLIEDYAMIHIY